MTYLRDSVGKFRKGRFLGYSMLLCGAILGLTALVSSASNQEYVAPQIIEIDNLTPKVNELKKEVLTILEKCESGGKKEEDGIVILDSNGVGSYGVLQFQRKTVMYYHEKRTGNVINGRDAILLALNAPKARDLAEWIIFESGSGLKDWIMCDRKHGLTQELALIKKLTN